MIYINRLIFILFLASVLGACDKANDESPAVSPAQVKPAVEPVANPELPGGATTVRNVGPNAFSLPSSNLMPSRKVDFSVGNSFFRNPWVAAPASTTARDGLGPLFNTNACQSCHIKDGRGHAPMHADDDAVSMLVRLSIPAKYGQPQQLIKEGVVPDPVYGGQFQDMAVPGIAPEGKVQVTYLEHLVTLSDGSKVSLREPQLKLTELAYGPTHKELMTSMRIAPPMIGLGLLEAIAESDLLLNEDPDDKNGDGISGRSNRVWDKVKQQTVMGRFGWKAGVPTIDQQNAGAFAGDMGLTSRHNSADDCTQAQLKCQQAPDGNEAEGYEVSDRILETVLFYARNLAVPARRNINDPQVQRGEVVFHESGCSGCHIPSFTTAKDAAEPELASQVIYPYTDLLLHDMGEALADRRPEFIATGTEWRTAPLWSVGLAQVVSPDAGYLHDGRARTVLEAILWHGGEAENAKQSVVDMPASDREALIEFVNSL